MHYRTLGRTDIKVSAVSMGCWAFAGDATWGPQQQEDTIAAVHAALDAGLNFFDTAEGYGAGRSEELLGKALGSHRHEAIIATKASGSHLSKEGLAEACEASLKRLGTDVIDLYQVHWPSGEVPLEETVSAMQRLRKAGKIRIFGVSNFLDQDLRDVVGLWRPVTNQMAYNLLWRAIEYRCQPLCVEHQVSLLCYSPLAQGLLTGKFKSADDVPDGRARTRHFSKDRSGVRHGDAGAEEETFEAINQIRAICQEIAEPMAQVALAWLLTRLGIASVIAGARNADQARSNAAAADLELPQSIVDRLTQVTEPLKAKFGPNADMWAAKTRMR